MGLLSKLDLLCRLLRKKPCAVCGLLTVLPELSTHNPVLSFSSVTNENVEYILITIG